MSVQDTISNFVTNNPVILFMKGTADEPKCGFSARAVAALRKAQVEFAFVDVLSAPRIREGLPKFSHFPTFPQLFVHGELIGGSDIVEQLLSSGELQKIVASKSALPAAQTGQSVTAE